MAKSYLWYCILTSVVVVVSSCNHSKIIDWDSGSSGGGSSYYRGYGYGSGGYGGGGGFHK